jgi:hypothetical protein
MARSKEPKTVAHGEHQIELQPGDKKKLDHHAWPVFRSGFVVGGVSLLAALIVAILVDHGGQRLAYAYLVAVMFALALGLGSMFFVLLTSLFRAGWCVLVRRVFEAQAANLSVVAILLVPVLVVVAVQNGVIYGWNHPVAALEEAAHAQHAQSDPEAPADLEIHHISDASHDSGGESASQHGHSAPAAPSSLADHSGDRGPATSDLEGDTGADHAATHGEGESAGYTPGDHGSGAVGSGSLAAGSTAYYAKLKRPFLNPVFFMLRVIGFAAIWAWIGHAFWKRSIKQDEDGDPRHSTWREKYAAPLTLVAALTVTFGVFDLLMSLDPAFYSTIFGVYYFAGAFLLALCWGVLTLRWLQGKGLLPSVNVEHYHDLGKLMFAFVFFWGYIAFSQYMLIWYANLPEITYWLEAHGMSTDGESPLSGSGWSWIALVLLFGHLLIPFLGLLSRRYKRNLTTLSFWAVWLIVMCYIDLYWVARPVLSYYGVEWNFADLVLAVLCLTGVMGIFLAGVARRLANVPLVPLRDPRLDESLALRQI